MSKHPIVLVVAAGENGVIGAGGGMPWRVRADTRRFRAVTMGKPIIMGRKTFESIGRALDGRDNIVVTRQTDYRPEGALVAPSVAAALELAETCAERRGADDICVIGGGEIYAATFPLASRLHVTYIAATPDGDTVFPKISLEEWVEVSREPLQPVEGDTASATYVVYERRR